MKGHGKKLLEVCKPSVSAETAIDHCLDQLYRDNEHAITDEVVDYLTYEELIGALLLARDRLEEIGGAK